MDLSEKGWIEKYFDFLHRDIKSGNYVTLLQKAIKDNDIDKSLYRILQPSGILYGHPITAPSVEMPGMAYWDEKEKMKLILLDSMLQSSVLINAPDLSNADDLTELIFQTTRELNNYYENLFPDIHIKHKTFWGRQKKGHEITESIIENRLALKTTLSSDFWSGFFQNSLLFLDVFYFGEWLKKSNGLLNKENIIKEQENMRLTILAVIAGAAHANNIIEHEEKTLFRFFVNSAHLSKENEEKAWTFLNEGIALEHIDLPSAESWVLRKYILELSILTIWSDKIVEESEKEYVKGLAKRLSFTEEELQSSMLAIESFVISNWEHVHYLQKKHSLHLLKKRFTNRISVALKRNKKAISQEISESKELIILLNKSVREKLSADEREKVKEQFIDIIKTLPTFVVIALPGTFITLPLLLKLLPRSVFPSAFKDDNLL